MRATREFKKILPVCQPRRFWLLAMGLALSPIFSEPCWAENYNLESVDFESTANQTHIILHTGSIVPVQKVLVSDNKLIVDIDQVNTSETVHTNFSEAGNISHVIMQPLSDHKIRMIVRGENLAAPTVAFYNAGGNSYSNVNPDFEGNRLEQETKAALQKIQSEGTQPATWENAEGLSEKAPIDMPAAAKPQPQTAEEPAAFGGFIDQPKHPANATENADTAPLPLHSNEIPSSSNEIFEQLTGGKLATYIPYGLLGLLLLGIGAFVRHKIVQLNQREPELEDLLTEQSQGKRVSFKDMASAYRNKHETQRAEQAGASRSNGRKVNAEDAIGLRSLHLDDTEDYTAPTPVASSANLEAKPTAAALENMIAALQAANQPKKAMQTPPPKKQAVNQYLQNQQQAQPKTKNRPASDEMLIKETKRAQLLQQELLQQSQKQAQPQPANPAIKATHPGTPMNRAAAAQKAVKTPNFQTVPASHSVNAKPRKPQPPMNPNQLDSQQGPLPGNPEVLKFLRNVADLMEKDGKGEIAKSIHKNLNTSNIRTTS